MNKLEKIQSKQEALHVLEDVLFRANIIDSFNKFFTLNSESKVGRGLVHSKLLEDLNLSTHFRNTRKVRYFLESLGVERVVVKGDKYYKGLTLIG